jgi:hypothetical protein
MSPRDEKVIALTAASCVLIVLAGLVIGFVIKLVLHY